MEWYHSSEKKFDCIHINKCDILIDQNNKLFIYNADWPIPEGNFRWVFLNELLESYVPGKRDYIHCAC